MAQVFDALVLGSGAAGLSYALKMAEHGTVAVVTKAKRTDSNTSWAQGGIAVVVDQIEDSFQKHIEDSIIAGDGLNDVESVRICVEEGPSRLRELIALGVDFTRTSAEQKDDLLDGLDLTREGGHSARRVVHAKDMTGAAIQRALVVKASEHPNIKFFEESHAIDLITRRRLGLGGEDRCLGAYVLDVNNGKIDAFVAKTVLLATGGAGKVYRYTTNPDIATGDGIAMAYRAGAKVANMEFFQFHPTCLYHPQVRNFLITEACRGEGGILRRIDGTAFMEFYDERKDLAPRDIVARAIDSEMKKYGDPHVLLDMTHIDAHELTDRFPGIHARLMSLGIDMRTTPIPVVPAAHYCCGGVVVDHQARTSIKGLLGAGEVTHTGLHGANRLASNSLLEAVVFADRATQTTLHMWAEEKAAEHDHGVIDPNIPEWNTGNAQNVDEKVLVTHAWDEIRRLMWNYVGIVRSNKRLMRARDRLDILRQEIHDDYWRFVLTPDLIELRNITTVASLIVECALMRKESRGLHYTIDYPEHDDDNWLRDTVLTKGRRS